MSNTKGVKRALGALWKAGQAFILPHAVHAVSAARQYLYEDRFGGPHPTQCGHGRVEHVVQRNRQLHDAQAGAKVPARAGHGVQQIVQLVGYLHQRCPSRRASVLRSAATVSNSGVSCLTVGSCSIMV